MDTNSYSTPGSTSPASRSEPEISIELFIGNLPAWVTSEDLRHFTYPLNATHAWVILDRANDYKSRRFGFAQFRSAEDAHRAEEALDGYVWDGKRLTARPARGHSVER